MARIRQFLQAVWDTRVLTRSVEVPKLGQLDLVLTFYKGGHPARFRRNLCIAPDTFDGLLTMIEDHDIFQPSSDRPQHQQMPVSWQLAVTLFQLGHFGNAASVESIAQWAGCSAGTVVACTRHIFKAVSALHDIAIRRPTMGEKEAARDWVEDQSCRAWRGGYCMVDGTLVPLSDKPGLHGEAYFDRKSRYSLSLTVCPTT
ncbi:hypothetical protein BS47DRAFT_1310041 [Hydnum rufescens UP504]|uniref:Uncharacterized protein n=1 Tax=Hydnum rufescens UP504 TaxID=1448309 RepID=A0A9P6DLQ1_9AGAM|nr:hypothetical protein BS47DRAFT_1310041 [Hydnum rufescens UP504]